MEILTELAAGLMEHVQVGTPTARLRPLAWTDVASILATAFADPMRPVASSTTEHLALARLDSIPIRLPIAVASVSLKAAVPTLTAQPEALALVANVKLCAGTRSIAPKANAALPVCASCLV